MIFKKKSILFLITMIMVTSTLVGCNNDEDTTHRPDETEVLSTQNTFEFEADEIYLLNKSETNSSDFISTPCLKLDTKNKTFTFEYDILSSYLNIGFYTEKDNCIIAITNDTQHKFVFNIVDEQTLTLSLEDSSPIVFTQNNNKITNDDKFIIHE